MKSTAKTARKPRRARAVVVEYLRQGKKTQLSIFDLLKKGPVRAVERIEHQASSSQEIPAALCFDCGQKLRDEEIDIGICSACFGPRR